MAQLTQAHIPPTLYSYPTSELIYYKTLQHSWQTHTYSVSELLITEGQNVNYAAVKHLIWYVFACVLKLKNSAST